LLEEVIVGASIRFQKEGQWWGNALSESKRTAPEFLQHVEGRLKQSSALTSCYIPDKCIISLDGYYLVANQQQHPKDIPRHH
jgi:hypothetical protein